jgi:uroporphyrinogen decarboxylase
MNTIPPGAPKTARPRERVLAALAGRIPDRVPRFEVWIDALWRELGFEDPVDAYAGLGQDAIMMPTSTQIGGRDGVDELGRIWSGGIYRNGAVDTDEDLSRFSPPLERAASLFDAGCIAAVKAKYPDHLLMYGSHCGPFTTSYLSMGLTSFFLRLADDPAFVERLLEARTDWCLALFREAVRHGAEVLVLGDDAGSKDGPMISPGLWRRLVLPLHRRIVEEAAVPVIWHSDGNIEALLPMAVEAGFAGVHGLEPGAGMDLAELKREYGRDLTLVGNIDGRLLGGQELQPVRADVRRSYAQGSPGGRFMISSCNSIFEGLDHRAVAGMFRAEAELGEERTL